MSRRYGISLTDDKILVQRQAFLLRGVSPPSEQRFLLAGTRLSVCFVVGHGELASDGISSGCRCRCLRRQLSFRRASG
jgi:hypothetical protein